MIEKETRVIIFSGKRNNWRQWSKKSLVVAEKREYPSILEKDPEELTIKRDNQKNINSLVYQNLMLTTTEDVSFGLINEAISTTNPEEDACIVRVSWCSCLRIRWMLLESSWCASSQDQDWRRITKIQTHEYLNSSWRGWGSRRWDPTLMTNIW